jgi:hypothetical protein
MLALVLVTCQNSNMKNTLPNKTASKDRENLRKAMILICRMLPHMSWYDEADKEAFKAHIDGEKFVKKMRKEWNK